MFSSGKKKTKKKKCVQTDLGYCLDCIVREGFVLSHGPREAEIVLQKRRLVGLELYCNMRNCIARG